MPSELLTERRGAALILTLSDPATRNALSEPLVAEGLAALDLASADAGIRCVIIQGAGGHFCAGGNLQGLLARREAGPPAQIRMINQLHGWIAAMRACPKPVIAAVEGAAAGAGFSIALACDLIVAAEDARFMLSHGRLGLSPDGGATAALVRAMPRAKVQAWVWLAEAISARELEAAGLVNCVTTHGAALAEALRLAERLSAMAPNAIASGKALVELAAGATLAEQLNAERDHFVANLFHDNGAEGLAAFTGKRPAAFR